MLTAICQGGRCRGHKKLGRGTQLVKLDIKDAYRILLIHPADYHLLGIKWKGFTY